LASPASEVVVPPKPRVVAALPKPGAAVVPRAALEPADGTPRSADEAKSLLSQARAASSRSAWPQARALYERVANGSFSRVTALLGIAEVSFQTRDYDETIAYGRQAMKAGGGSAAQMYVAHGYSKKKQYERAIREYQQILAHDGQNAEARRALADAQTKAKGDVP